MRRILLALVLVFLLAACMGDDDDVDLDEPPPAAPTATSQSGDSADADDPTATTGILDPTPTEEPTETSTAMATSPRPTATDLPPTATGVEPTATSEPDDTASATPEPSPTSDATVATAPPATSTADTSGGDVDERPEDDLAVSLVLDQGDVPAGWVLIDRGIGETEDSNESLCGAPPISSFLTPTGISQSSFQVSDTGPFFRHDLALFATEEDAITGIEHIRQSLTCSEWTSSDEQGEIEWLLGPLDFPTVGDETVAREISFTLPDGLELHGDYVIFRQGRALSLLVSLSLDEKVPTAEFAPIAETAATRIVDGLS